MSNTGCSPTPFSLALDELCEKGTAFLDAAQPGAAEQIYRAILAVEPKHPASNYRLGMLCMQRRQHEAGLPLLLAALEAKPEIAEYWLAYIEALLLDGQIDAAQQFLTVGRQHGLEGKALEDLASRLTEKEPAKAPPELSIDQGPASQKARHQEMAFCTKDEEALVALFNEGRHREGAALALALTERFPHYGFAWKALGTHLQKLGQDALPALQKAAELLPGDVEAHWNLGVALQAAGQFEKSLASFAQVLKIKPDHAAAHFNQGYSLKALWQLDGAVASYRQALAIKPDFASAYNNLADALCGLGRPREAEAHYRSALAIKPDFDVALTGLGVALEENGGLDSALECYRQALEIDPANAPAHCNLLLGMSLSEAVDVPTLVTQYQRFSEQFEAPLRAHWPQHANSRDPARCLQIGFVSGDLRHHAVASFIEPLLEHLAGFTQLCLHAYYNHHQVDGVTLRLRKHFAHWHSVASLSDEALAQKIAADGIDILIDLSGHSAFNRLLCFARKPAPVQLSWLGVPGSTGLAAVDYFLSDRFFLPPGQFDSQFTEKIVRLPAYAAFLPSPEAPPVNALPALTNGFVTFGNFNRMNKLSPAVVALWAQLLRSLPDSRMLVGGMPVNGNYDTVIEWFAQQGIARERLDFRVRSTTADYLAMHHQVDICLDTFPYNGATVTYHALSMGVPTLNLAGDRAAGRAGSSILGNVGLDGFIASNKTDFVEKGRYWAEHLAELSGIRAGLRERFAQSAAGQPKLIATALAQAWRIMWQRWCAGLPAESFEVSSTDIADRV